MCERVNFDYDRRQGKPMRGTRFTNKEGEFLKKGLGEKGETSGFNQNYKKIQFEIDEA